MLSGTVSVILATYNGALYLRQQLESLACQTFLPTELVVGDDGSWDETCSIIERFIAVTPFAVRVLSPLAQPLGPCLNFARLMQVARGDYIFFCDQDDVWLPDKICVTLEEMQRLEAKYGLNVPCLVHTDLKVISADGSETASSYWKYQHFKPQLSNKLQVILSQNLVTGCTMMLNRAAISSIGQIPQHGPLMHDWWIALAVNAFGGYVSALNYQTVLYRQHPKNVIGACSWWQYVMRKLLPENSPTGELRATQQQAAAFLRRFGLDIPPQNRRLIQDYAQLSECGFWARRMTLWRHGIHKSGKHRTLGLYLHV